MEFKEMYIPDYCVQWGQSASYVDAQIPEGSYLRCCSAEIFTPSDFYVNLSENWFQLEQFMKSLQATMIRRGDNQDLAPKYVPKLELLTPGLFILCRHRGPKCQHTQWHRAMVLKNPAYCDGDGPVCKKTSLDKLTPQEKQAVALEVRLIDYGTWHVVNNIMDNVRYMDKEDLQFPVQGIKCRLAFPKAYADKLEKFRHRWPTSACDRLFQLFEDRILGVVFYKRSQVPCGPAPDTEEITNGLWMVSVDLIYGLKQTSTTTDLTDHESKESDGDRKGPKRQFKSELKPKALLLDPALAHHSDGMYCNLVEREHDQDISIHFLRDIDRLSIPKLSEPNRSLRSTTSPK